MHLKPHTAEPPRKPRSAPWQGTPPADSLLTQPETNISLQVLTVNCRDVPGFDGHELVVRGCDRTRGLRAFIAIHSTRLGPALGGCRMWPYASDEDALQDALRLSQGMSCKHAVAGTRQGGGKAVIIGNPRQDKSPALFAAFGRLVDRLNGVYITAEDVGTTVDDMVQVHGQTPHVAGLPVELGGSGDPSPVTAYGVYCGIQAAVAFQREQTFDPHARLDGITVAVQGTGHVGSTLCQQLRRAGAQLIVTDVDALRAEPICRATDARFVAPEDIYDVRADVFSPCALGGTLNAKTVPRLRVSIVAGAANNQLADPAIGRMLAERGILYAPDYVINAGGVINISYEKQGYDPQAARRHTARVGETLTRVFQHAADAHTTTAAVADAIAWRELTSSPQAHC